MEGWGGGKAQGVADPPKNDLVYLLSLITYILADTSTTFSNIYKWDKHMVYFCFGRFLAHSDKHNNFLNIFAKKFSEKIDVFDSKQS
jgi:hypothetical protein